MNIKSIGKVNWLKGGLPNTVLSSLLTSAFGLCSGMVLARSLGPEERGAYAAVLLWPTTIVVLGDLGLGFAIAFFANKDNSNIDGLWFLAWAICLTWGGLLAGCAALFLPPLIHVPQASLVPLLWNLTTIPITLLSGCLNLMLLGVGYIREYNRVRIVTVGVYAFFIMLVAVLGCGSVALYTISFAVSQWVGLGVVVFYIVTKMHPRFRYNKELTRPVLGYGANTYLSSIAAQLNLRLDQLLMSSYLNAAQFGYYVIAVSFANIISPLLSSVAIVTLPRVRQREDSEKSGAIEVVRCLQLGIIIGLPAVLGVVVLTPILLPLFFGGAYAQAFLPARVLLAAVLFQGLNSIMGNAMRALGRPGVPGICEIVGLGCVVLFMAVLVPQYGTTGSAVASLTASIAICTIYLYIFRASFGVQWANFYRISCRNMLNLAVGSTHSKKE